MKQAFEERRFGKILIAMELIQDVPHRVHEFFYRAEFLVLVARYIIEQDAIEYTLVHPKFAPVPEGQIAPHYSIRMQAIEAEEGSFENQIVGWDAIKPVKKGE